MRCRLILLISDHPIQQVIRKGGGPHFCDKERTDEERRGGMAYSRQLDIDFTKELPQNTTMIKSEHVEQYSKSSNDSAI